MMEKPAREKEQYPTFHPSINYISSLPHPFFVEWLPPSVVSTFTSLSTCGCFSKVRRYFAAIKTITGHKTFSSTGWSLIHKARSKQQRQRVRPTPLTTHLAPGPFWVLYTLLQSAPCDIHPRCDVIYLERNGMAIRNESALLTRANCFLMMNQSHLGHFLQSVSPRDLLNCNFSLKLFLHFCCSVAEINPQWRHGIRRQR